MTTVEAIYENGILRLKEPIELKDGTSVDVCIIERAHKEPVAKNGKTPAEIMAEIAALSEPVAPGEENVAAEHDKYLYGWKSKY